jgi:hypothetical protein
MDSIRFNNREDGLAIAQRAGTAFNPSRDISICRLKDDVRLGGAVYTNYTQESIAVHSAGWVPHWISRDLLYVCFDYPFNQLGVNRMFAYVPEDNTHAIEVNFNFGFTHVVTIAGMFQGGIACYLMKLERTDCRFLGVKPRAIRANYH